MKPPKCSVCGAEEWRHVCAGQGGTITAKANSDTRRKGRPSSSETSVPPAAQPVGQTAEPTAATSAAGGISAIDAKKERRREYLKLKARERRKRQKAEREASRP